MTVKELKKLIEHESDDLTVVVRDLGVIGYEVYSTINSKGFKMLHHDDGDAYYKMRPIERANKFCLVLILSNTND